MLKYRIEQDTDAECPRKNHDNAGKMVCWHRRYILGDEMPEENMEWFLWDLAGYEDNGQEIPPIAQMLKRIERTHVILPLYLYDHSGITMNTSGFGCRWDSGQVGYIYIDRATGVKEWGRKWRKMAEKRLISEVKTYAEFISGEVYGYVIFREKKGKIVEDHIGSCWGFYGHDYCEEQAKEQLEYFQKERSEAKAAKKAAKAERKAKEAFENSIPSKMHV